VLREIAVAMTDVSNSALLTNRVEQAIDCREGAPAEEHQLVDEGHHRFARLRS